MTLHLSLPKKPQIGFKYDVLYCSICEDNNKGIFPCHLESGGERGETTMWVCSNDDCQQEYE